MKKEIALSVVLISTLLFIGSAKLTETPKVSYRETSYSLTECHLFSTQKVDERDVSKDKQEGDNVKAILYDDGKLIVSGTGRIGRGFNDALSR